MRINISARPFQKNYHFFCLHAPPIFWVKSARKFLPEGASFFLFRLRRDLAGSTQGQDLLHTVITNREPPGLETKLLVVDY